MRWRGITVLTNTPPRSAQSAPGGMQGIAIFDPCAPGGMQGIAIFDPILAKAARRLGLDQIDIRRINAPEGKASFGPAVNGVRAHATSAFIKEALDRGAEQFRWRERAARTPKRAGTRARGVGVSLSRSEERRVGEERRSRWAP